MSLIKISIECDAEALASVLGSKAEMNKDTTDAKPSPSEEFRKKLEEADPVSNFFRDKDAVSTDEKPAADVYAGEDDFDDDEYYGYPQNQIALNGVLTKVSSDVNDELTLDIPEFLVPLKISLCGTARQLIPRLQIAVGKHINVIVRFQPTEYGTCRFYAFNAEDIIVAESKGGDLP